MKKLYFLAVSLLLGAGVIAQTTVTSHFEGALTDPQNPQVGTYQWNGGNGYVSGTNAYGDKAILQLFDSSYGVSGAGTVDNVKIWIGQKDDAGNNTTVTVGVWENNNGTPGALLGSQDVEISAIDTSQANTQLIMNGQAIGGLYNLDVTFASPVAIPANESFFTGITLPSPTEATAGDTIVVVTTTDGGNYQFADAATHAGTLESSDAWAAYGANQIEIANGIFPTMTFSGNVAGENLEIVAFPNPASDLFTIKANEGIESVRVIAMDGREVINTNANGNETTLNVASLNAGVYYYEITTLSGLVSRKQFVKK